MAANILQCAHSWVGWKNRSCPRFSALPADLPPERDFAGPAALAGPGGAAAAGANPKADPAAQPPAAPAAGRRVTRAALLDLGSNELNRRARRALCPMLSARRGWRSLAAAQLQSV